MGNQNLKPGISGMAVYVPPLRVALEQWCDWNSQPWEKVSNVVGRSFRMLSPKEDVYSMAATAVLRLIKQYDIDPSRVGMLALGTESSKDNSTGAVIVRGMVDQALTQLGKPILSRACEVPEYKHACLGGMYALKGALRFVATDGGDQVAIVVAADTAEYARGSSGEQTQGAGAVAMLVEPEAKLFSMNLKLAGVASAYRGPDFRKPMIRHFMDGYTKNTRRLHDFPVFSGRYSTFAYIDETLHAARQLWRRLGVQPWQAMNDVSGMFFHRPYHHMPVQGLTFIYLDALYQSGKLDTLKELADAEEISLDAVARELGATPDLYSSVRDGGKEPPYPQATRLAGIVRKTPQFKEFQKAKLKLGSELTKDLGNLYTAALPAWLAAGMEDALNSGTDISGQTFWAIGYGSGDAAEAVPIEIADGWRDAAARIHFSNALENVIDLNQEQYEALHDHGDGNSVAGLIKPEFSISRLGQKLDSDFQDLGVPYYEYHLDAA